MAAAAPLGRRGRAGAQQPRWEWTAPMMGWRCPPHSLVETFFWACISTAEHPEAACRPSRLGAPSSLRPLRRCAQACRPAGFSAHRAQPITLQEDHLGHFSSFWQARRLDALTSHADRSRAAAQDSRLAWCWNSLHRRVRPWCWLDGEGTADRIRLSLDMPPWMVVAQVGVRRGGPGEGQPGWASAGSSALAWLPGPSSWSPAGMSAVPGKEPPPAQPGQHRDEDAGWTRSLVQEEGLSFLFVQFLKFILNRRIITPCVEHAAVPAGSATGAVDVPACQPLSTPSPIRGSVCILRPRPGCPPTPAPLSPASPACLPSWEAGLSLLRYPYLRSTLPLHIRYSSGPAPRRQSGVQPSQPHVLAL